MSNSVTVDAQSGLQFALQGSLATQVGATAAANGNTANVAGFNGALLVEVWEQNTGTCDVVFEGSLFNFASASEVQSIGYVDLSTTPRSVALTELEVTQNTCKTYLLQDPYPFIRARTSDFSSATIMVTLYAVPS